jgi:hypothetical protein
MTEKKLNGIIFYYIGYFFAAVALISLVLTVYWLLYDAELINISMMRTFYILSNQSNMYFECCGGNMGFKTSWYGINAILDFIFVYINGIISGSVFSAFFFWLSDNAGE